VIRAVLMALLLSGCASVSGGWFGRGGDEIITRPPPYYDRAEIDAINAEAECRRLARTMVQAQRCGVRR
jgi:hypothetical protein